MKNISKKVRSDSAFKLVKALMNQLITPTSRSEFFSTLTFLLKEQFDFDRFCINLYDQETGSLTLFSEAEGAVISSLSSVRVAGENTVAGKVVATKSPLVITNIARYFSAEEIHPLTEAGLSTTMAFPLIVNDQLIGILHCSFQHEPEKVYLITEFFLEICPFIATSLALVLSLEQSDLILPFQDTMELAESERFIIGAEVMKSLFEEVRLIAQLDIPILILGETGTGKSLLAEHIHKLGTRKKKNFVKINCPALVSSLFESELFGHAKGAFTGANNKRIGRFELAHNGTLFLDEIAELSMEMQSKLLHALENSSFERVGESSSISVDVRMITATNVDIPKALANDKLRADFYYRLASYTLTIPPLRERKEDIPLLLDYLAIQSAKSLGLAPLKLNDTIKDLLSHHKWLGNIRELKNVIQQLLIQQSAHRAAHRGLHFQDVENILKKSSELYAIPINREKSFIEKNIDNNKVDTNFSIHENERNIILKALKASHGRISGSQGAAEKLGIPRSTLQYRMKKLNINPFSNTL